MYNKIPKRAKKSQIEATKALIMPSMALVEYLYVHDKASNYLRLGQWFFNNYCTHDKYGGWPDLFYAPEEKAKVLINQWLIDNHYEYYLPITNKEREELMNDTK